MDEIEGVVISKTSFAIDTRGVFSKILVSEYFQNGFDSVATSTNPKLGTIRGLHFQAEPFAEEKIVTCIQGSVFDVILDIRPTSSTFGKWASLELSDQNRLQIYLPKGIAHGFQTLQSDSIVQYCLSINYSAGEAFSIDPFGDLQINWPLENFFISSKDKGGISFKTASQIYARSLKG